VLAASEPVAYRLVGLPPAAQANIGA